jgi:hypothetical protein
MIGAWLIDHLAKNSRGPGRGALGVLAICSGDEGILLALLLPRPTFLLLLLGDTGGKVLGGILLPLFLGIGEDGSDRLFTCGEVGGDI